MGISGTAAALAGNPAAPADVLLRLLAHGGFEVTERLRWRASMPDEVAVAMARHPDRRVRHALAGSWTAAADPRLPRPRLLELLGDPELGRRAAANPALPAPEMHALLDREGVAR
ncbi:hypothetical protein [Streptomyces sp. t39]|uniref:hypothetical protein n=1 Tax=Streptomyces sp. t39 TaxID=1828156 RepID=UPI0011CE4EFA|nr:hypothetical protein [Streptomyces sp. t39]TXS50821.1 hypothetical protein EAO77_22985 [Streptomyces sp. t39]